jgi:dienelactone hydrolase
MPKRSALLVAATIAALVAPLPAAMSNTATAADDTVGIAEYNLGDTAFTMPGFLGPNELQAVVHYPTAPTRVPRPLVLVLHGMWSTCVDEAAHEPAMGWPCPAGQVRLPSYLGYDYLGDALARKGFIVVSIGVNGINAANPGDGYADRAHLISKHLELWRDLATDGGGELAGAFVDPATGAPVDLRLRGQVDVTKVGVVGHSRGGTAAMLHSSAEWQATWPSGVRVAAVFGMAPVYDVAEPAKVTSVPFAILDGSCDAIRGAQYFDDVRGHTTAPIHHFTVHGANHNFQNTQWSPASGQAGATDDANHEGLPAGQCTDGQTGSRPAKQLTETQQRTVTTTYASAFFERYLADRTELDPVLTGLEHPVESITPVDVRWAAAS